MEFLVSKDRRTHRIWVVCTAFSLIYDGGTWKRGAPTSKELESDFEYISKRDIARQFYEAALNAIHLYPELGRCLFGRKARGVPAHVGVPDREDDRN